MYGKIVNDELILAPEKTLEYEINGKHRIICNPLPKHYAEAGYKVVEYGEVPEITENIIVTEIYTEDENKINVGYKLSD